MSTRSTPRAPKQWPALFAEALLVVLSILLAFAIDAWWDERKASAEQVELLEAIRADFAATDQSIDEALETAAGFAARTGGYLEIVAEARPISRDSPLFLLEGVSDFTFYEPSLASYRNAVETGALDMMREATLLEAFTDFDLALRHYELHLVLSGEMYYLGAVHDLRLAMGGFEGPAAGRGGLAPSREFDVYEGRSLVSPDFDLRGKESIAAAEALYWAHINAWDALSRMDQAAARIVVIVDGMLRGRRNGSS
jgi:hypothetical protein